jgi:hypothetical protein
MAKDWEQKTETPQGGPRYPGVNPKPERQPDKPKPADKPRDE